MDKWGFHWSWVALEGQTSVHGWTSGCPFNHTTNTFLDGPRRTSSDRRQYTDGEASAPDDNLVMDNEVLDGPGLLSRDIRQHTIVHHGILDGPRLLSADTRQYTHGQAWDTIDP